VQLEFDSDGRKIMIAKLSLAILLVIPSVAAAQEKLADQLHKAIVEEEVNQKLDKAIEAYTKILAQYDEDRKVAATALFHFAECCRKLGQKDKAVAAYQRVIRDFADHTDLAGASRSNLTQVYGISTPKQVAQFKGQQDPHLLDRGRLEKEPQLQPGIVGKQLRDDQEQMREFLLKAKVVSSRLLSKGITSTYRLTLTDGTITHDAVFESIDEFIPYKKFDDDITVTNFRDSYKCNLAAYELAKLLGLGDMMPVTVERSWEGKAGSLTWWLPVKMDEAQRLKQGIHPPDPEAWNQQMYKMRVFAQLVCDKDRNLTNVLISEEWHLWMIDFTRAFRLYTTLENPNTLVKCDRQLLQRLRQLDRAELERRTKQWLREMEVQGVMARRDKIVALFDSLIAQKGEDEVLYGSAAVSGN
jgi:tetratricopeptide (TPR) repeat protein